MLKDWYEALFVERDSQYDLQARMRTMRQKSRLELHNTCFAITPLWRGAPIFNQSEYGFPHFLAEFFICSCFCITALVYSLSPSEFMVPDAEREWAAHYLRVCFCLMHAIRDVQKSRTVSVTELVKIEIWMRQVSCVMAHCMLRRLRIVRFYLFGNACKSDTETKELKQYGMLDY